MNYTDKYIHRLKSKGINMTDSLIKKSKIRVNEKFHTSPSFSVVKVNGIDTESIVNHTKKYDEMQIHFKPNVIVDMGSIVEYKNKYYLLMEFIDNEIYPTATLKLCNSTFPIESDKSTVLIGRDSYGRPIYEDQFTVTNEPCVVETKYFFNNRNEQITLPEDRIMVTLKYQEASNIEINKQFDMYKSRFAIKFIDYSKVVNNVGVMTITGERVMSES